MGKKSSRSKSSPRAKKRDEDISSSDQLPGWPGYRTREGRSGYDPIDTRTEAAHTAGTIVRRLFTGQIRNPLHLLLLAILGLVLVTPLILAISELMNGSVLPWNGWILVLVAGGVGLGILINFLKNLLKIISK